jgi:hypothetical protein
VFYTMTPDQQHYDAWLQDDQGRRLETTMDWDDDAAVVHLTWDGYFGPTPPPARLDDCAGRTPPRSTRARSASRSASIRRS